MNVGMICDISKNQPIGVIAVDKTNGSIGYIVDDHDLENTIEIILDNKTLDLTLKEDIDGQEILRNEQVDTKNPYYLMAFNYHLPYPWKILGMNYEDGELEPVLQQYYDLMEGSNENE